MILPFSIGDRVSPLQYLLDRNEFAKDTLALDRVYTITRTDKNWFEIDNGDFSEDFLWTNSTLFWRLIEKKSTAFSLGEIE